MQTATIKVGTESAEKRANDKAERIMNGVAIWTSFYRANPHRFAKDYLNLELKLFQQIIIFFMEWSTNFMYLASRSQGKTFIVAVFCCIRCILYPGTRVCVASKTRGQATEVINKIKDILMPKSANLRAEIESITSNATIGEVVFKNGSAVVVVTASDSARHNRANVIIVDEFRMVDPEIINKVIRKFNGAPRNPGYLSKPEYEHLQERNKEIYLSSCWYQSHWSFEKAKAYCANLVRDTSKYFICGLPYQLAIKEGLLMREAVQDEMSEADFSEVGFSMEMEALWFGDADGGLYSYADVSSNRKIFYPYFPHCITDKLNDKRIQIPEKGEGEIRILSADLALMASTAKVKNDATSIFINCMMPNSAGRYTSNIRYTENYEGVVTDQQALILRSMFEEYDCDYLTIDTRGVGAGVADLLLKDISDPETGKSYCALSCCNNDEYAARCTDPLAPKVIWAIAANSQFNTDCAIGLRDGFRQGKINLLISEYEAEEYLSTLKGYNNLDLIDKMTLKLPFMNTTALIEELINLEYTTNNGAVKVHEKSGFRKDRYSSLSYNYYVARYIERERTVNRSQSVEDMIKLFAMKQPKVK